MPLKLTRILEMEQPAEHRWGTGSGRQIPIWDPRDDWPPVAMPPVGDAARHQSNLLAII